MKESRCIICGEKKNGLAVRNDYVIESVRWFKKNVTKNEKNYRLVVCKDCFLKYKKARDSYQRKELMYTTLGAVFAVLLVFISRFSISAFAAGIRRSVPLPALPTGIHAGRGHAGGQGEEVIFNILS